MSVCCGVFVSCGFVVYFGLLSEGWTDTVSPESDVYRPGAKTMDMWWMSLSDTDLLAVPHRR